MTVVMSIGFVFAWMPYSIVSMVSAWGDPTWISPGVSFLPVMLAKSSAVYNPIIYYFMLPTWRKYFSVMLKRICPFKNQGEDCPEYELEIPLNDSPENMRAVPIEGEHIAETVSLNDASVVHVNTCIAHVERHEAPNEDDEDEDDEEEETREPNIELYKEDTQYSSEQLSETLNLQQSNLNELADDAIQYANITSPNNDDVTTINKQFTTNDAVEFSKEQLAPNIDDRNCALAKEGDEYHADKLISRKRSSCKTKLEYIMDEIDGDVMRNASDDSSSVCSCSDEGCYDSNILSCDKSTQCDFESHIMESYKRRSQFIVENIIPQSYVL